jgi:peptidoglycan/LPS O-acetylase OafA/YrhL
MPWGDKKHRWLIELPIIRLPYLGLPMVNIFFIVAGYVIALKPLQLMQAKPNEKLLHTLCSSVFRRFLRLYLPVLASTLLVLLATRLYLMEFMRPHMIDKAMFPGTREKQMPRFDTIGEQLVYWYGEMGKLTSVWDWRPFYPLHDPHLWTIQYEFRSSLVLYLLLLLVAKVCTYVRLAILFAFSVYSLSWDRWEIVLYLWGTCLAQLDIIRAEIAEERRDTLLLTDKELDELPPVLASESSASPAFISPRMSLPHVKRRFKQGIFGAGFILALWLLSAPKVGFTSEYGYQTLSLLIPSFYSRKEKFLPTLGSVLLLWLLTHCSPSSVGHRILNGKGVQYLARISFSLYLVHGPLLHLYGYYVPILVWKVLDRKSTIGYCAGILIGWCVNLAFALWAADVFYREVDLRCVRIAKWLEEKCFVKE